MDEILLNKTVHVFENELSGGSDGSPVCSIKIEKAAVEGRFVHFDYCTPQLHVGMLRHDQSAFHHKRRRQHGQRLSEECSSFHRAFMAFPVLRGKCIR